MNMSLTILIISWIICGILSHGLGFAYWQRAYSILARDDYWLDWVSSVAISMFGPFALISNIIFIFYTSERGYQGFKFI